MGPGTARIVLKMIVSILLLCATAMVLAACVCQKSVVAVGESKTNDVVKGI